MNNKKYWRICPKCGEEIPYKRIYERDRAEKRNTNCKSCVQKGKKRSKGTREKMKGRVPWNKGIPRTEGEKKNISESLKGKNHPMYGKPRSEETKQKIRKTNKGKKRSVETKKRLRESHIGQEPWNKGLTKYDDSRLAHTKYAKKRMRISAIKRIEKQNDQIMPNSNPKATLIIRAKAKELGITDLQDAETPGGEFQVCGYFVDGRSKEKNIVIEYYEKAHKYKTERDKRRKNEIIKELGCEFIEIWE